jgi:purine nucleosidase
MQTIKVILDVDMGIDDATALAWLLQQERVAILGIVTVAGNTTPENSANNALNVLAAADRTDIEVAIGATRPLQQVASHTGKGLHGPDGLWSIGAHNPQDISGLSRDILDFYCRQIQQAGPGVTILALGPLTNLALAVDVYPDLFQNTRIIAHAGSREGGSRTPHANFNCWFDPEAVARILTAHTSLTLIAGTKKFGLSHNDIVTIRNGGTALGRFIAGPLQLYAQAQAQQGMSDTFVAPDIVAAVYAVDPSVGTTQPALVKIAHGIFETDINRLLRGKMTIGIKPQEKVSMIADDIELSALVDRLLADPGVNLGAEMRAILAREPDNAQVVLDIDAARIHELFMEPFTRG